MACGIQLITGFGIGISTMAVIWALSKLKYRKVIMEAVKEIKAEKGKIKEAEEKILEERKKQENKQEDVKEAPDEFYNPEKE